MMFSPTRFVPDARQKEEIATRESDEIHFIIDKPIKKDRYGVFYRSKYQEQDVVIQTMGNTNCRKIAAEIAILKNLEPLKHVIQLFDVIEGREQVILVYENFDFLSEDAFYNQLSRRNFRKLLKSLCLVLCDIHSHGIVHRDLRFTNILVSSNSFTDIRIAGWTNGSFSFDDMSPQAGSRNVRPPDMLLGNRKYQYSCDSWAIGIYIFTVLSEGVYPFKGTSQEMMEQMSFYYGKKAIMDLIEKYNLPATGIDTSKLSEKITKSFDDLVTKRMSDVSTKQLVELAKQFLELDPEKRIRPIDALSDDYFKGRTSYAE